MLTPVSTKEKQAFIRWFLHHYKMKQRESGWILDYLASHQQALNTVHFVRDVAYCPRSLILSSACSDQEALIYFKEGLITTDSEQVFHDMRLNYEQSLYIQLNFPDALTHPDYVAVLEDNPYLPIDLTEQKNDRIEVHLFLQTMLFRHQQHRLKAAIDLALDDYDRKRFLLLVQELALLEKSHVHQMKAIKRGSHQ